MRCQDHELFPRFMIFCSSCYSKAQGYCSECESPSDTVTPTNTKCLECNYGRNWKPDSTKGFKKCKICEEHRFIDRDDMCQKCYTLEVLKGLGIAHKISKCTVCTAFIPSHATICKTCAKAEVTCKKCDREFSPTMEGELFCDKCKTQCLGCDVLMNTHSRLQRYCRVCADKKRDNICLGCDKTFSTIALDPSGFCTTCRPRTARIVCSICQRTPVSDPEAACKKCTERDYHCLVCEESVGYKFYTCTKHRK